MAFIGLGIGATGGPLGAAALALGLAAAAGVTALFWQVNVQHAGGLPRYTAGNGRVLADPDDAMLAVPLLLWSVGPEPVLLVAGTITPLLAALDGAGAATSCHLSACARAFSGTPGLGVGCHSTAQKGSR